MAKIKLGNRPKSFKHTVRFPMLEGGQGAIEVNYKYRTKSEFAEFIDETVAAAGTGETEADKFSMVDFVTKTLGANVNYILDVIDGWNLDDELNATSVRQLADELPAAAIAVMDDYRRAINEGRLGN